MQITDEVSTVMLGGERYPYSLWDGEPLGEGTPIAFDTETEAIEDINTRIPRVALCTASDGTRVVIFPPDQLTKFISVHADRQWVGHNLAFDFHVVLEELRRQRKRSFLFWDMADNNQFADTMLLDMLIRLARYDAYPSPRNLAYLASDYAGVGEVNKNDPWRMRYGELIGVAPSEWPKDAIEYAVKDAIVTSIVYKAMSERAREYCERGEVKGKTIEKFGPLSLAIQTKAAIAFAAVEKRGLSIDAERVDETRRGIRERMENAYLAIAALPQSEGLFTHLKDGSLKRTKTGTPCLSTKVLRDILGKVAEDIGEDTGSAPEIPRTPTGALSASIPEWEDWIEHSPFLGLWKTLQETGKLLQFFTRLEGRERVHPRYTVMVRTGRTSATNPNIQQIPRSEGIREVFRATPGNMLVQIDYSFIELRTLATVCEELYGYSELATVIRNGVDPHVYTAAMVNNLSIEEFIDWKQTDPQRFKNDRQSAKAVNFGIPGGLGPRNLAKYAQRTYGVEMSVERAGELREKIITVVYPELERYLSEDSWSIMARSIGCNRSELIKWICRDGIPSQPIAGAVRKILAGNPFKWNGEPYNPEFVNQVWEVFKYLNTNEELSDALSERREGVELMRAITYSPVKTLTGRIRGRVSYSQARNTPFQGLAADGAKLAIYRMIREGFAVVGFVHDETLLELPDRGGWVDANEIQRCEHIMIEEMQKVCPLPIGVESGVGYCWSKGAGINVIDNRAYPNEQ